MVEIDWKIVNEYCSNGYNLSQISKIMNIPHTTFHRKASDQLKEKSKINNGKRKIQVDWERVKSLLNHGYSVRGVSRELKINFSTLTSQLKRKYNLTVNEFKNQYYIKNEPAIDYEYLDKLIEQGLRCMDIPLKFPMTKDKFVKIMKKDHGIYPSQYIAKKKGNYDYWST